MVVVDQGEADWEGVWETIGRDGAAWPQSESMSDELPFVAFFPLTRLAKSASSEGVMEVVASALPPQPVCFEVVRLLEPLLADSSWSLRVCSLSIREDRALMRVIYAWNWGRSRRGPRLKLHMMGKTSIARNSESATLPTCLKTLSAAIYTCQHYSSIGQND